MKFKFEQFDYLKAHCGTALCLVAVGFLGCDRLWTLTLLTLSVGLMGAVYAGFLLNHLDLAPNLAGTVYGLISALSSINSWLAPLVVATLTEGQVIITFQVHSFPHFVLPLPQFLL